MKGLPKGARSVRTEVTFCRHCFPRRKTRLLERSGMYGIRWHIYLRDVCGRCWYREVVRS